MISLTDHARAEVQRLVAQRQLAGAVLRFGVQTGGCSGLQYSMDFADETGENDHVFDLGDVKVVCDRESLPYLDGLTVDFSRSLVGGGFKFHNPNEKDRCGCGESFNV